MISFIFQLPWKSPPQIFTSPNSGRWGGWKRICGGAERRDKSAEFPLHKPVFLTAFQPYMDAMAVRMGHSELISGGLCLQGLNLASTPLHTPPITSLIDCYGVVGFYPV